MKNRQAKNYLYIGATVIISVLTIGLTAAYLSEHKDEIRERKIAKMKIKSSDIEKMTSKSSSGEYPANEMMTSSSSSSSQTSSSQTEMSSSEVETSQPAHSEPEVTQPESMQTESEQPVVDESQYSYLYTAAGGDDLQTVADLTGVDVATLARVNNVPENVVLEVGQKIYVP